MNPQPRTVLIVDDTLENLRVLGEMLELDGHEVRIASHGLQALEMARLAPPDLILLDVMMPGIDGHEVCRRLKADPALAEIPVIFLTALNDEADEALGLDLGAVDYVTKPFKMNLVRKRIHNHLVLRQLQLEEQRSKVRLEEQVRERTQELSEANHRLIALNATKSQFLRLLSEEVQAPANSLVGIGQIALACIDDAAKKARLQALFEGSKARLVSILGQYQRLVDLQDGGPGLMHPVRLEDALDEAWRARLPQQERARGAEPTGNRSFIVAADHELLREAVSPLLGFLADGGTETLEAELSEHEHWVVLVLRSSRSAGVPTAAVPLEDVSGPGENLALAAAVFGALGATVEAGPSPARTWQIRVTLPAYRPSMGLESGHR